MDIKTLQNEFAQAHTEAGKLLSLVATEKRSMTGEEKQSQDARYARMDMIKAQVDEASKLANLALITGDAILAAQPKAKAEFEIDKARKVDVDAIRRAINVFARTGNRDEFALTAATTNGSTAVYLPQEVVAPIVVKRPANAFRAIQERYGIPALKMDKPVSISLPVQDDSAVVGQAQDQAATSGTAADPAVTGSVILSANLYSSKQLWFSNTMLDSLSFDLFAYCLPMLLTRIEKVREAAWVTKLTGASLTTVKTATTSTLTYANWLDFEHSVKPAYRGDMGFVIDDSAYKLVRGLVDSNARPILDLDPTNSFQAMIHGKPVFVTDKLQATGAINHYVAAAVSASAMTIYDAGPQRLARYIGVPSNPDQTGFELFANGDFNAVSSGAALLETPAA